MGSSITRGLADLLTAKHEKRKLIFGDKPYANYGYWTRAGMPIDEACDALTDLVARAAGVGPGDRVLEVGCGCGAGAVYYTLRYQPASVAGIDVTEVRVEEARAFITSNQLADTIQVGLGDATALAFPDGAFTRVLAVECAFHFNTRRDFFREAARVLTPGGTLALTDVIPRRGADLAHYRATVHFPAISNGEYDVYDNVYDADAYAAHLRAAGFEDARLDAITDQTMRPFADHLEALARRTGGALGDSGVRLAQRYRDFIAAGAEVVLVGARKGA